MNTNRGLSQRQQQTMCSSRNRSPLPDEDTRHGPADMYPTFPTDAVNEKHIFFLYV